MTIETKDQSANQQPKDDKTPTSPAGSPAQGDKKQSDAEKTTGEKTPAPDAKAEGAATSTTADTKR